MILFPYENFYIVTKLKPEEVQLRLEKEIEPPQGFNSKNLFPRSSDYYFSGYAVNGAFKVKRITIKVKRIVYYKNRNSFLPQITGTTEAWVNGSRIHIKMRMYIAVIIFICFWLGVVGLVGIAFLAQGFSNGQFNPASLMPFGMFIFGYAGSTWRFKYESKKVKNKLLEILDGEVEIGEK